MMPADAFAIGEALARKHAAEGRLLTMTEDELLDDLLDVAGPVAPELVADSGAMAWCIRGYRRHATSHT